MLFWRISWRIPFDRGEGPLLMKSFQVVFTVFLSLLCGGLGAQRVAPFSISVGTQTIGVRYQFTDETALVETARLIEAMGSDTLKFALTPKYPDDYLMKADSRIQSLADLIQYEKSFEEVMDMPFRNFMIWVYPFADQRSAFFRGEIPEAEAEGIYREIYDFTVYLLTRYAGSGKSFFLGNWEGDWHVLKEIYDYNLDPEPATIEASKAWFLLREKAIADARRDTPHEGVEVYFYIELNHVKKSIEADRPAIVNAILPFIKTDYVSWSSYDVISDLLMELDPSDAKQQVFDALDYIERHLPPSDVPGKRVFIGEYGFPRSKVKEAAIQSSYTAAVIKWGLEWGCPFILYWELYCNEIEPETGKHRGYWLIDDQGVRQPTWFLHQDFLDRANHYVRDFQQRHGKMPTQEVFNREAAAWIQPFSTWKVTPHR